MADKHLGQSTPITTVTNEEVIFTTEDGKPLRMRVSDLAKVIKGFIPTFGFFSYNNVAGDRWKKVLTFDSRVYGEVYAAFLFTGGSYTNSESCCIIINIMIGALVEVSANRISGNARKGSVNIAYKWDDNRILEIWIQGTYSAGGSALINLSSINLLFENTVELPSAEAINVPIS